MGELLAEVCRTVALPGDFGGVVQQSGQEMARGRGASVVSCAKARLRRERTPSVVG